jgi:dephospho-CoA kinase
MIVAGLTGSIAMGKTTIAAILRARGAPVLDADEVVHGLYEGEAAPLIEAAFPGTVEGGKVNRASLSARVLSSPDAIRKLEAIVHPLVRKAQATFLLGEHDKGADLAILEIPLLLETAPRELFDAVIVASAPEAHQRERLMGRSGMTLEKIEAILARQMPDSEKRAHADYVVDTGVALADTEAQINAVLADIMKRPPVAFLRWMELYEST